MESSPLLWCLALTIAPTVIYMEIMLLFMASSQLLLFSVLLLAVLDTRRDHTSRPSGLEFSNVSLLPLPLSYKQALLAYAFFWYVLKEHSNDWNKCRNFFCVCNLTQTRCRQKSWTSVWCSCLVFVSVWMCCTHSMTGAQYRPDSMLFSQVWLYTLRPDIFFIASGFHVCVNWMVIWNPLCYLSWYEW